ncbi:MAG: hypothetical protein NTY22_07975 [Proteobacteria bacterium]|nr:hypothetical protein [Pseudomonadota bacterium]
MQILYWVSFFNTLYFILLALGFIGKYHRKRFIMSFDTEQAIASKIVDKYRKQGYEIIFAPRGKDLPFDLGSYHPDLIVRKSPNEGYIIELKRYAIET